jgi:hypothetical protein
MNNWKEIPIPAKMEHLPKDKRGYPISFTTIRDAHGAPYFPINDEVQVRKAAVEHRCGICGKRLEADIWLLGGPLPAFHPKGSYLDPAVHGECGTYALQVCPYLALPSYSKQIHNQGIKGKPPFMVFVKTGDYNILPVPSTLTYISPVKPFLEINYWLNGSTITRDLAEELFRQDPIVSKYFPTRTGFSPLPLPAPGIQ